MYYNNLFFSESRVLEAGAVYDNKDFKLWDGGWWGPDHTDEHSEYGARSYICTCIQELPACTASDGWEVKPLSSPIFFFLFLCSDCGNLWQFTKHWSYWLFLHLQTWIDFLHQVKPELKYQWNLQRGRWSNTWGLFLCECWFFYYYWVWVYCFIRFHTFAYPDNYCWYKSWRRWGLSLT